MPFMRRAATRDYFRSPIRGLKPTEYRSEQSIRRSATPDGSRGFQPTDQRPPKPFRRGATVEPGGCTDHTVFMRRDATRDVFRFGFRGLKPTATIMMSLRDQARRIATTDGSRALRRPDVGLSFPIRRSATTDCSRGFQPTGHRKNRIFRRVATVECTGAVELAAAIQTNMEELGV